MSWELLLADEFERRQKHYEKKHSRELQAVLVNLQRYVNSLNAGVPTHEINSGFIHPESLGVIAIDQKGGGKNLAQTRLYVYPEIEVQTLHVITLGDKKSQKDDLRTCKNYVESLRKALEEATKQTANGLEANENHEEEIQQRDGDGQGNVGQHGPDGGI